MKIKNAVSVTCFAVSCALLAAFLTVFVLFLVRTSVTAPSFAEAAKNVLVFMVKIAYSVAFLAFGVVFAGIAIKLSQDERMRKRSRRLLVAEMVLFLITAGIIASMYVII